MTPAGLQVLNKRSQPRGVNAHGDFFDGSLVINGWLELRSTNVPSSCERKCTIGSSAPSVGTVAHQCIVSGQCEVKRSPVPGPPRPPTTVQLQQPQSTTRSVCPQWVTPAVRPLIPSNAQLSQVPRSITPHENGKRPYVINGVAYSSNGTGSTAASRFAQTNRARGVNFCATAQCLPVRKAFTSDSLSPEGRLNSAPAIQRQEIPPRSNEIPPTTTSAPQHQTKFPFVIHSGAYAPSQSRIASQQPSASSVNTANRFQSSASGSVARSSTAGRAATPDPVQRWQAVRGISLLENSVKNSNDGTTITIPLVKKSSEGSKVRPPKARSSTVKSRRGRSKEGSVAPSSACATGSVDGIKEVEVQSSKQSPTHLKISSSRDHSLLSTDVGEAASSKGKLDSTQQDSVSKTQTSLDSPGSLNNPSSTTVTVDSTQQSTIVLPRVGSLSPRPSRDWSRIEGGSSSTSIEVPPCLPSSVPPRLPRAVPAPPPSEQQRPVLPEQSSSSRLSIRSLYDTNGRKTIPSSEAGSPSEVLGSEDRSPPREVDQKLRKQRSSSRGPSLRLRSVPCSSHSHQAKAATSSSSSGILSPSQKSHWSPCRGGETSIEIPHVPAYRAAYGSEEEIGHQKKTKRSRSESHSSSTEAKTHRSCHHRPCCCHQRKTTSGAGCCHNCQPIVLQFCSPNSQAQFFQNYTFPESFWVPQWRQERPPMPMPSPFQRPCSSNMLYPLHFVPRLVPATPVPRADFNRLTEDDSSTPHRSATPSYDFLGHPFIPQVSWKRHHRSVALRQRPVPHEIYYPPGDYEFPADYGLHYPGIGSSQYPVPGGWCESECGSGCANAASVSPQHDCGQATTRPARRLAYSYDRSRRAASAKSRRETAEFGGGDPAHNPATREPSTQTPPPPSQPPPPPQQWTNSSAASNVTEIWANSDGYSDDRLPPDSINEFLSSENVA